MLPIMSNNATIAHIDAICDLMDLDPILNASASELDMAQDEFDLAQNEARSKIIDAYCAKNDISREDLLDLWCRKTEANG